MISNLTPALRRKYTINVTSRASRRAPLVDVGSFEAESAQRIRFVVLDVFAHFFPGRRIKTWWGKDGFMGMAWDQVGNNVEVYQDNYWTLYGAGQTLMPRPLCPMVLKKAA